MRCKSWSFFPLVPFCCISTPYPLASLPSHAWSGKTRRAEICRLTMEGSCSGCISLSWAELVVRAFLAPFPPTATASLASSSSRRRNTPPGRLGMGKTKHDTGFVCTEAGVDVRQNMQSLCNRRECTRVSREIIYPSILKLWCHTFTRFQKEPTDGSC